MRQLELPFRQPPVRVVASSQRIWQEAIAAQQSIVPVPPGLRPQDFVLRSGNPKDLIGDTKPQLHLNPQVALLRMAKVFELGAKKYGPYNWRSNAVRMTVYLSAAMRHLAAMNDGQSIDPESGQPHAAHVMACMAIVMDASSGGNLIDDRELGGKAADVIASLTEKRA